MTRGVVLKLYGNPEIAGAIADGMARALPAEQIEVVQAEIDRQHIQRALVRVAVGNTRTAEDYRLLAAKARGDYGYTRPRGRLYGAVWGLIGALVLAVDGWYRYFSAWNRSE